MTHKIVKILKILIPILIISFLISRIELREFTRLTSKISPFFIGFALFYYTGCQILSCLRWQIILKSIGHLIGILNLLSSYFGGMFLNTFLPGTIGGDVYRVYRIYRQSKNVDVAFASVLLERATGIAALLIIAIIGLPPMFHLIGSYDIFMLFLLSTSILGTGTVLMTSSKILAWTEPFFSWIGLQSIFARFANIQYLFQNFVRDRFVFSGSIFLSIVLQLILVYYYYLIAQQLNIQISYVQLLVFIPIITIISLLPFSIGGIGIREGIVTYLFNRIGISIEQSLIFSLTITALGWLLSLPGGIIILFDSTGMQEIRSKKFKVDNSSKS